MTRNEFDIILTAVANVSKGQTDIPYQGAHHTLTKQSIKHQVCPNETCCTIISISTVTTLMSRGRSNCGIPDYVRIYTTFKVRIYITLLSFIYYYLLFIKAILIEPVGHACEACGFDLLVTEHVCLLSLLIGIKNKSKLN